MAGYSKKMLIIEIDTYYWSKTVVTADGDGLTNLDLCRNHTSIFNFRRFAFFRYTTEKIVVTTVIQ